MPQKSVVVERENQRQHRQPPPCSGESEAVKPFFMKGEGRDPAVVFLVCLFLHDLLPLQRALLGSPRCRAHARPRCFFLRTPGSPPRSGRGSLRLWPLLPKTSGVGRSLPQPRLTPLQRGEGRGRDRHRQRGERALLGERAPASGGRPGLTPVPGGRPVRFQPRTPSPLSPRRPVPLHADASCRGTAAPGSRPRGAFPGSGRNAIVLVPRSFSKTTTPPAPAPRVLRTRFSGNASGSTPQKPSFSDTPCQPFQKIDIFSTHTLITGRHSPSTFGGESPPLLPRCSATVRMRREGGLRMKNRTMIGLPPHPRRGFPVPPCGCGKRGVFLSPTGTEALGGFRGGLLSGHPARGATGSLTDARKRPETAPGGANRGGGM